MNNNIEEELTAILNKAVQELQLTEYSIKLNINANKGEGFLGDVFYASIVDKTDDATLNFVIKRAPKNEIRRKETCIKDAYKNEIHFYENIMPTFRKFQQDYQVDEPFNHVPRYITSTDELGKEMMVLENITFLGYQMRAKDFILDEEHARFIFQTYGRYHALGFCLKHQRPKEYEKLIKSCCNVMKKMVKNGGFSEALSQVTEQAYEALKEKNKDAVAEKFQKYVENSAEIFEKRATYEGNYSTILHGDCWSNNMMFKYQNAENKTNLENINLIDFQITCNGTPVYDLSYFFYSGGSEKLYEKLSDYLDLYYASFSEFSKKLGCNPEVLLPRVVLSEEWKKYAVFGMLMSLLVTKIKLLTKEQSIEMSESIGETGKSFRDIKTSDEIYNERVRNLLVHMYQIDAL